MLKTKIVGDCIKITVRHNEPEDLRRAAVALQRAAQFIADSANFPDLLTENTTVVLSVEGDDSG